MVHQKILRMRKIVTRLIPEGRIKDMLRYLYLQKNQDMKFEYDPDADSFTVTFNKEPLKGETLIMPEIAFRWIWPMGYEIPGYLQENDVTPGSIVVDGGAFPGDFSVLAARRGGKVMAFEPDPDNRIYTEKMIRANRLESSIAVLPIALAGKNGSEYLLQKGTGSTIMPSLQEREKRKLVAVQTATLDDVLQDTNAFSNSKGILVKLDIEGAEIEVVKAAKKTLYYGASFAIAAYHLVNGKQTHYELTKIFKEADYSVKLVNPRHLTLVAGPKRRNLY